MILQLIGLLSLIAVGSVALLFVARMRLLGSASGSQSRGSQSSESQSRLPDVERYRPMLRLLSDADLDFVAANPMLREKIRAQRREVFRGYLRCLTKDYARLLGGIRAILVESPVERPELTKALVVRQAQLAWALCRIDLRLMLHALGVGNVDVTGLVEALDSLRGAASVLTPVAGAAY